MKRLSHWCLVWLLLSLISVAPSWSREAIGYIEFSAGWTNCGLTLQHSGYSRASELYDALSIQGFEPRYVCTFQRGRWRVYQPGLPISADFPFSSTVAVFTFTSQGGPLVFRGVFPEATLRVMNAMTDVPLLEVNAGDRGFPFEEALSLSLATPSRLLLAGDWNLSLTPLGDTQPVLDLHASFDPGTLNTLVAYGNTESPRQTLASESLTDLPTDEFRLRFLHAAPSLPPAQIYDFTIELGEPLFAPVAAGGLTEFVRMSPGRYVIGIDLDNFPFVFEYVLDPPFIRANTSVTVVIGQKPSGQPYFTMISSDGSFSKLVARGSQAQLRLVNLAQETVDLFAGGLPFVAGISHEGVTPFDSYNLNDTTMDTYRSRTTERLAGLSGLSLEERAYYTTILVPGASGTDQFLIRDQISPENFFFGTIRLMNLTASYPVLNFLNEYSGFPLGVGIARGQLTEWASVTPIPITVGIDVNNDSVMDYHYTLPGLATTDVANAFVIEDAGQPVLFLVYQNGGSQRIVAN